MNIECRRNVFYLFYKKIERHTAHALALRERNHPSKFCGSLFALAESHTMPYLHDEVSYKVGESQDPET